MRMVIPIFISSLTLIRCSTFTITKFGQIL